MNFLKDKYMQARLIGACGILGIMLIVGSLGYQLWFKYFQSGSVAAKPCNLRSGSCTVTMSEGRSVTLGVNPKALPANEPISLEVRLQNISFDKVYLTLFATEQKYATAKTIELTPDGYDIFHGKVIIPAVSEQEKIQWVMVVQIKKNQETLSVPFRFTANSL